MAKRVSIQDIAAGTPPIVFDVDFAEFRPNWFIWTYEALDRREALSWAYPATGKVIISPVGVAYPGDAILDGNGPKRVTLGFVAGILPPFVVLNRLEDIVFDTGWFTVTKGQHVVAWSPKLVLSVHIEPTL